MALADPALAFLIARIGNIAAALFYFMTFALLDRLLPTYLDVHLLILQVILRARKIRIALKALDTSPEVRLGVLFTVVGSLIVWALHTSVSFRLVYHGCIGHVLDFGVAKILYLQNDGPPNHTSQEWILKRDSAIVYGIASYSLTHRGSTWVLLSWLGRYLLVPCTCYVSLLLALRIYMARSNLLYRVVSWPLSALSILIVSSLSWYSLGIAFVFYFIPNNVDMILSRLGQLRRQGQGVSKYTYYPLRDREFRLLRLERRVWIFQGSVKATLIHCNLDSAFDYEAVSYRWGSDGRTDEILVDDMGTSKRFSVTKSAFDLLLARRSIWRKRIIWIDAICIDQDNNEEKGVQVKLMREIYQRATRVIVFPSSNWYARAAAPLILELYMHPRMDDGPIRRSHKLAIGERYSHKWRTVIGLFTNEYFNRIWVAQEIAVGKDVQLYYGGLYIPWSIYYRVVSELIEAPSKNLMATGIKEGLETWHDSATFENMSAFSALRTDCGVDIRADGNLRLETVILATSKFKATDPRDLIFAILGVSDCRNSDLLHVNYRKLPEEVLQDATKHLLFEYDPPAINIFCLAGTGFSTGRLAVPSWVPDRSEERKCIQFTDAQPNSNSFTASSGRVGSVKKGTIPKTLCVRGVLLADKIQYLSSAGVFDFGGIRPGMQVTSAEIVQWKNGFVQAAKELVRVLSELRPAELHAYNGQLWFALIAERIDRGLNVDPRYRKVSKYCFSLLQAMAQSADSTSFEPTFAPAEILQGLEPSDFADSMPERYLASFMEACFGRCFAITEVGRFCLVPPLTQIGDALFVPFGAQTPYVVRKQRTLNLTITYELVGEAYAQAAMRGEAISQEGNETVITLV